MSQAKGPNFPIAVLISGTGTNLQALIDSVHQHDGIEIVAVASSRADALGLERARQAGIETAVFSANDYPSREQRDSELAAWLKERNTQLIVMAGFMELLTPLLLNQFPTRIINVHPALLPAFPGVRAIERQLEHGVKVGGVTVHFVDAGMDTGPIVLQEAIDVPYTRSQTEFESWLHKIEHRLLPKAVRLLAAGAVKINADNARIVHVDKDALRK